MISTISLRMLKSFAAKNRLQVGQRLGTEGADRLLDQVVEQLLDEGGVRLLAAGQERRELADSRRT